MIPTCRLPPTNSNSVALNGSIGYGSPWAIRFQGRGVVGGEE